MTRYLLDTNIVSAYFRAAPDDPLVTKIAAHSGELAIASVVWHELRYGWRLLAESRRKAALGEFLESVVRPNFPILEYDAGAADWHAHQRALLRDQGVVPPFVDGQIAAVAGARDLTVVTENMRHFKVFASIRLERWPILGSGA